MMLPASSPTSFKLERLKSARRKISPRPIVLLMLLLARPSLLQASYLCDFLVDNSWQSFRDLIETSYGGGFVMLCPFIISGDGCPDVGEVGYTVPTGTNLYIMCEPYYSAAPIHWDARAGGNTGCIVDCPGIHFQVDEHASLTLDSLTIRGSSSSAIKVQPNGSLTVFNSHFEENKNEVSNGGAIFAAEGSEVYLSQASFLNNTALNGGAVYNLGNIQIHNSNFSSNVAESRDVDSGGGALFSGPLSKAYITNSYFAHNLAMTFGPAILDMTSGNYSAESNTGCNNTALSLGMSCNGALQAFDGVDVCSPFDHICELPTAAPTGMPTVMHVVQGALSAAWSSQPPSNFPAPEAQSPSQALSASTTVEPTVSTQQDDSMFPPSEATDSPSHIPSFVPSGFQGTLSPSESTGNTLLWEQYFSPSPTTVEPSIRSPTETPTIGIMGLEQSWQPTTEPSAESAGLPSVEVLSALSSIPTADASQAGTYSASQMWTYDSTDVPTEVSTSIESLDPSELDGQREDLIGTISPTSLELSDDLSLLPVMNLQTDPVDSDEWVLSNASTQVPSNNEANGDFGACMPLNEYDVLQAVGSYSQGSMDESSFDSMSLKTCGSAIAPGGASKLFYVVGTGAVLTAHTCSLFFGDAGFDTQLSIYTSNKLGDDIPCARDLLCVGSNDDFCGQHSLVNWYAEEGRGYFIQVQSKGFGFDSASLQHHFSLTLAPTPGGSCQQAISVRPNRLTGELELGDDPSGMDLLEVGGFVWFLVTESDLSWPIASTCQENVAVPTRMEVFRGSCGEELQKVETIERNCIYGHILTWLSAPGESYYIKVSRVDHS